MGDVVPKRVVGSDAPARTHGVSSASGSKAPARGILPASAGKAPASRSYNQTLERTTQYFSKCIICSRSWGGHDHEDGRCPICSRPLQIFVGKMAVPPGTAESLVPYEIARGTAKPRTKILRFWSLSQEDLICCAWIFGNPHV